MKKINSPRTRKKHSKRLATLALKLGYIPKKTYENLYLEAYTTFRKSSRKRGRRKFRKYNFTRYYKELYYCTTDYFGEVDETSIIQHLQEFIYWDTVKITQKTKTEFIEPKNDEEFFSDTNYVYEPPKMNGGKIFKNTLHLMRYLQKKLKNESFNKGLERR